MSRHAKVYFGMVIVCEKKFEDEDQELFCCWNDKCVIYQKETHEKFCPKCGSKIEKHTVTKSVELSGYEVISDHGLKVEYGPWFDDRAKAHYYVGDSFFRIDCEYEELQDTVNVEDIKQYQERFTSKFARDIEILQQIYDPANVRVQLMILNYSW